MKTVKRNKNKIMAHLIDKSALVAEMNKLKNISLEYGYTTEQRIVADVGKDLTLKGLLDYTNTLEVKEVDLEKEIENYLSTYWPKEKELHPFLGHIAKCFYELGMAISNKTQKGQ